MENKKKDKKSVRWDINYLLDEKTTESIDSNLSIGSNQLHATKSRTSLYELSKKFDEIKLRYPDRDSSFLLPQLVSANRRSNTEFFSTKRNSNFIYDENKRKNNESKKKFSNIMDSENSGFYS
jgi:hypothetical protein